MSIKLVSYGVGTLILNVRYSNSSFAPVKQELDETLQKECEEYVHTQKVCTASDWKIGRNG